MRILIHGMNYAPEFIGVGKYTSELATFLAANHHEVEVVTALPHYPGWVVRSDTPWRYQAAEECGIRVTRCPLISRRGGRGLWRLLAPLSFALAAAPVVVWRSLKTRPHVILCVEPTLFAAPAALLAARLVGARAVLHVQDLEIDAAFATGHMRQQIFGRAAQAVERAILGRFSGVVTISEAMAARLKERGVDGERLAVLRNWVDPTKLAPGPGAAALRSTFGIAEDKTVVLYAGSLGAKQGLGVVIEAARRLRADPRFHFLIVGEGPMAVMMRAAAGALSNLDVVGLQPSERLGDLLAMADTHLLPQDPAAGDLVFPSKLGSMLATAAPIIVTADPWTELARWLAGAAAIVPPGDGQTLARMIQAERLPRDRSAEQARRRALVAELQASSVLAAFEHCLVTRTHPRQAGEATQIPAAAAWMGAPPSGLAPSR